MNNTMEEQELGEERGGLDGKAIEIARQMSLSLCRHMLEGEADFELIAVGKHPKPHRSSRHAEGLLAIGEGQLRIQVAGHREPGGAEAAHPVEGQVLRERLKDRWEARLAQADRPVGANTWSTATLGPDHTFSLPKSRRSVKATGNTDGLAPTCRVR